MLSDIDSTNIQRNIRKLFSFGTRHTLSAGISNETWGIGAARDWIYSDSQKYEKRSGGRLIAEIQTYEQEIANRVPFPTNISNVLTTIKGSEDNGRVYVITGHYDTRVTDVLSYKADAPGANVDGSGTALVMELTPRPFNPHPNPPSSSPPSPAKNKASSAPGCVAGDDGGVVDVCVGSGEEGGARMEVSKDDVVWGEGGGGDGMRSPVTYPFPG